MSSDVIIAQNATAANYVRTLLDSCSSASCRIRPAQARSANDMSWNCRGSAPLFPDRRRFLRPPPPPAASSSRPLAHSPGSSSPANAGRCAPVGAAEDRPMGWRWGGVFSPHHGPSVPWPSPGGSVSAQGGFASQRRLARIRAPSHPLLLGPRRRPPGPPQLVQWSTQTRIKRADRRLQRRRKGSPRCPAGRILALARALVACL